MADPVVYPGGAGITDKSAADLESGGIKLVGTDPSDSDPWETDYSDIRDAAMSNPGGAIGDGTAATGLNVSGDSDLDGAVVINDAGADKDTRIEGDTDTDLLVVDAGSDHVNVSLAAGQTSLAKLNIGGAIKIAVDTTDTDNPPTEAQIDAAIGQPEAAGSGYIVVLDDDGGEANVYLVVATATKWWQATLTVLS